MWKKLFCPPCLIGSVLVLAVLGGYFLLKGGYQAPTQAPTQAVPAPGVAPGTVEEMIVSETEKITVIGTEFAFSPSTITVEAGQEVMITFQNEGKFSHNLIIEGLGVGSKTIGAGKTDIVEFVAPTTGTYTVFCSIPGHQASGMEGQLNVE